MQNRERVKEFRIILTLGRKKDNLCVSTYIFEFQSLCQSEYVNIS